MEYESLGAKCGIWEIGIKNVEYGIVGSLCHQSSIPWVKSHLVIRDMIMNLSSYQMHNKTHPVTYYILLQALQDKTSWSIVPVYISFAFWWYICLRNKIMLIWSRSYKLKLSVVHSIICSQSLVRFPSCYNCFPVCVVSHSYVLWELSLYLHTIHHAWCHDIHRTDTICTWLNERDRSIIHK